MNDDALDDLLAAYADALDAGGSASPEEFARLREVDDARALSALRLLAETAAAFDDAADGVRRIGPYRILGVVGRGGVGVVFRAEREDAPGKIVALKVLALQSALSARAVVRFRREAQALSRINHPGVVRIFESGEAPEGAYVAMEYVAGQSLADVGVLEARRAAELVRALARAVAAAHAEGVVHRDLKPANVVLRPDGNPVLLDFGLAADAEASTLTATGDVLGTPRYMAPEQARGEDAGPAADVYALGAVLHELLTGLPPHGVLPPAAVLETLRHEPAPPVRAVDAGVPEELAVVVDRALAFDPARRYGSAAALADDLEAWGAGRPTSARPPSTVERLRRALRRRRRAVLLAGVAAAAVVTGVLVSRIWMGDDPRPGALAAHLVGASEAWLDGDAARTRAEARAASSLDPSSPLALMLDAATEGALPATSADPALRAFLDGERRRIANDPVGAFQHFDRAAALAPDVGVVQHRLGLVAEATERPDLALRAFDRAVRALPGSKQAAVDLGRALGARNEHAEAARTFAAAVDKNPDDGDLWYRLAKEQYLAGDNDAAVASAGAALGRLGENGLRVYVLYGVLLDRNGRRTEARAAYDTVLRRRPKHVGALYNKAVSFDSEHLVKEAETFYLLAHEADPRDVKSAISLANLYAGASRDVCEGCRESYVRHPECLDRAKALDFALRALGASAGANGGVVDLAVTTALKIDEAPRMLEAVETLLAARRAESSPDGRAAASRKAALTHLERAAAALRRPAPK